MDDPKGISRRNFVKRATAATLVAGASHDVLGSIGSHLIEPREQQIRRHPNDEFGIATSAVAVREV